MTAVCPVLGPPGTVLPLNVDVSTSCSPKPVGSHITTRPVCRLMVCNALKFVAMISGGSVRGTKNGNTPIDCGEPAPPLPENVHVPGSKKGGGSIVNGPPACGFSPINTNEPAAVVPAASMLAAFDTEICSCAFTREPENRITASHRIVKGIKPEYIAASPKDLQTFR